VNEASKDVEVGGKKYRVGRVAADVGTWIAMRIGSADESSFLKMQRHLLSACSSYNEAGAPMPILMADGRWADKDLEFDTATVAQLFTASFEFNIQPFMLAVELKDKASAAASDTSR
jgi:hypothetical protein